MYDIDSLKFQLLMWIGKETSGSVSITDLLPGETAGGVMPVVIRNKNFFCYMSLTDIEIQREEISR